MHGHEPGGGRGRGRGRGQLDISAARESFTPKFYGRGRRDDKCSHGNRHRGGYDNEYINRSNHRHGYENDWNEPERSSDAEDDDHSADDSQRTKNEGGFLEQIKELDWEKHIHLKDSIIDISKQTAADWAKKNFPKLATGLCCSALVGLFLWSASQSVLEKKKIQERLMRNLVSSVTITLYQQALQENVRVWVLNRPQLFWDDNDVTASFGGAHRRAGQGVKSVDDDGFTYADDSHWRVFSADPDEDDEENCDDTEGCNDGDKSEVGKEKEKEGDGSNEKDFQMKAKRKTQERYFLYVDRGDMGDIVIFCTGRSCEPIRKLLRKIQKPVIERGAVQIHVPLVPRNDDNTFNPSGEWDWQYTRSLPRRSIESSYLDPELKARLGKDIEQYLEPSTRDWYQDRGIPYRRGYLLHGLPGTGKTSFATAVAGEFQQDIYTLSMRQRD